MSEKRVRMVVEIWVDLDHDDEALTQEQWNDEEKLKREVNEWLEEDLNPEMLAANWQHRINATRVEEVPNESA